MAGAGAGAAMQQTLDNTTEASSQVELIGETKEVSGGRGGARASRVCVPKSDG